MEFDVNMDEAVRWTNKLERLPRSAFPNAVRGTLNSLAFDVKKNSMPLMVSREFINRDPNFFRVSSHVNMAYGYNADGMYSEIGFDKNRLRNPDAAEELNQQEHGGMIGNRTLIPTDAARTGKSRRRQVARRNRIRNLRNVVRVSDSSGKTDGQRFIQTVIVAGKGGHVLTATSIFRVDRITGKSGSWKFKTTKLYSVKRNRSVKIESTKFMSRAASRTSKKTFKIFESEANRQIDRHFR